MKLKKAGSPLEVGVLSAPSCAPKDLKAIAGLIRATERLRGPGPVGKEHLPDNPSLAQVNTCRSGGNSSLQPAGLPRIV